MSDRSSVLPNRPGGGCRGCRARLHHRLRLVGFDLRWAPSCGLLLRPKEERRAVVGSPRSPLSGSPPVPSPRLDARGGGRASGSTAGARSRAPARPASSPRFDTVKGDEVESAAQPGRRGRPTGEDQSELVDRAEQKPDDQREEDRAAEVVRARAVAEGLRPAARAGARHRLLSIPTLLRRWRDFK